MKEHHVPVWLIISCVAVVSAVVAGIMFRTQIFDFVTELKGRLEDKRCCDNVAEM